MTVQKHRQILKVFEIKNTPVHSEIMKIWFLMVCFEHERISVQAQNDRQVTVRCIRITTKNNDTFDRHLPVTRCSFGSFLFDKLHKEKF